jgi:hypothetical protein
MASQSESDAATFPGSLSIALGQICTIKRDHRLRPVRIVRKRRHTALKRGLSGCALNSGPVVSRGCTRTRSDQLSRVAALAMKIRPKRSPM